MAQPQPDDVDNQATSQLVCVRRKYLHFEIKDVCSILAMIPFYKYFAITVFLETRASVQLQTSSLLLFYTETPERD